MASKNPLTAGFPPRDVGTKEDGMVHNSEQASDSEVKHSMAIIHGNAPNDNTLDTNFQESVQKAEAITIAWTLKALIVAYSVIWCVYFVQGIVIGVGGALLPYVTSDFAAHSLIPTTGVLSQVIGGIANLCIAKILGVLGRHSGFLLCVIIATLGLIMAASCNGVEKAKRQGVIPARTPAGRTLLQSVLHYVHDFNVVGLLLLSAGFAFLLLPFNLYTM
ncbi:putative siderophore iron transporter mirb protein [Phaeoacremonium minimum UCRPA7]|uniref:Putative siderophore iron transporter mirb protein n=1 Tax=Phaeoacremonium minimum (strain UCR-PA7) TaxID=1286976 RepID=R8B8V6_PHAM7|nr:putative siderophore iron transporter mirb protein [Phaeoacremonium minimum UCRPA7]EON95740.1 putative siderophore iron transporter mirb protein [Phaeoacremonium minimum UCRPA7]